MTCDGVNIELTDEPAQVCLEFGIGPYFESFKQKLRPEQFTAGRGARQETRALTAA